MKVLLVDDDPDTQALVAAALRENGHDVTTASNGSEGWDRYRSGVFPLVITDWMMPRVSGLELCRMIRELSRESYTYIVITTALSGREHFLEGMKSGADDFVVKPINFAELAARLVVAERILGLHSHVTLLEGLLSICAYCKKIRDEDASWQHVERYIAGRTGATFSHSICPTCRDRVTAKHRP